MLRGFLASGIPPDEIDMEQAVLERGVFTCTKSATWNALKGARRDAAVEHFGIIIAVSLAVSRP